MAPSLRCPLRILCWECKPDINASLRSWLLWSALPACNREMHSKVPRGSLWLWGGDCHLLREGCAIHCVCQQQVMGVTRSKWNFVLKRSSFSSIYVFLLLAAAYTFIGVHISATQRFFQRASQVVLVVKNLPANAGDRKNVGSIPGLGRSPGGGNGNPLQYSCLENPMDGGAWRATVHGSQTVGDDWSNLACEDSASPSLWFFVQFFLSWSKTVSLPISPKVPWTFVLAHHVPLSVFSAFSSCLLLSLPWFPGHVLPFKRLCSQESIGCLKALTFSFS